MNSVVLNGSEQIKFPMIGLHRVVGIKFLKKSTKKCAVIRILIWNNFCEFTSDSVLFDDVTTSRSKAINSAKQIYRACMNVDDLNKKRSRPLLSAIDAFGYWPAIDDRWDENKFDLSALLINITRSRLFIYTRSGRR